MSRDSGAVRRGEIDYVLLGAVLSLLALGTLIVFSASSADALERFQNPYHFFERQVLWSLLGLGTLAFTSRLNYWRWPRWAFILYVVSVLGLIAVLVPHIGQDINGARRWVQVGPLVIQPSELAKLAMVIMFAWLFTRHQDRITEFWSGLIPLLGMALLVLGLILLEPDLGTTIAVGGTFVIMLFAAGVRKRHLLGLGLASLPAMTWAVFGESYRRQRMMAFLDPWKHPLTSGFHTIQALLAMGSGGLFGVGLGHSLQAFGYLPEDYTDFIFAILGEELGLIGTLFVIALFAVVAWRGFRAAMRAPDTFSGLLALGLTSMITIQAAINIGVVTATLPVTGITLPFISYGGSSLVLSLAGVGILLNISRYAR